MPHLSQMRKIQLAVSCCKGVNPFPEAGRSAYRYKKFRDTALVFGASHRFHSDPFDRKGLWVQDVEDCQLLFEARAILVLLSAAIRKKHLRINKATDVDLLITLAEFSRRLLFDEECGREATDLVRLVILVLESHGLGSYAQLFLPQEATVIAGC